MSTSNKIDPPIPFVDIKGQYANMESELNDAILGVCRDASFIRGAALAEFESRFAEIHGVGHAISVASGTDALKLAVETLGIGSGDEVITVPNTWISTSFAISHTGATPVFVDIDPDTYQMDVGALEKAITPKTKAILPVHLYGHPAPMPEIVALCKSRGLYIVEDVAQAVLARINGQMVGAIGDIACYSFYPSKNLGCYGDGGMVITDNDDLAAKMRMLCDYGQVEPHLHQMIGYNSRLDSLQAAVLLRKLPHLEAWTAARRRVAGWYDERLADLAVKRPVTGPGAEPVYHLYVIQVDNRDACVSYLRDHGVLAQIHYPSVIHLQPCYQDLGYHVGDMPVAEAARDKILSLPIYPEITEAQVDQVTGILRDYLSGADA
ncbi:MAG: DegT/DnrJ/EryC1/StrS family aminotransferase [Proteobacteria bacterium]|nr:DegT/DnrJ/EryC1/StrS family aminotransferase [Pseudomonadota bacterium]